MNQSFQRTNFEPQDEMNLLHRDGNYMVRNFLAQFDAIFTLNQDLLLERHYLDDNLKVVQPQKWSGWHLPGIKPIPNPSPIFDPLATRVAPCAPAKPFMVQAGLQPYFKLHGSSNWLDSADGKGQRLLIMGGNKAVEIKQYPVLDWYHQQFREYLARPGVRLMVIGYSFGDHHINEAVGKAATNGQLGIFIIDPAGVDVLDKQDPRHPIRVHSALQEQLEPCVIGASRRSLTAIFGNDRVEHDKVTQFFVR
jgi:hypothetical protein